MGKNYSSLTIEDFEEDTSFLMLQVSNLWKNYYDRALKKYHGLSHLQYAALAGIYLSPLRNSKQLTQTMLSKQTQIDTMALSHIFRKLETKGYIYRVTHPTDIRAKVVNLTPEGEELMKQVLGTIAEADQKFFKSLGKNTDRFNKYLKKLLDVHSQFIN